MPSSIFETMQNAVAIVLNSEHKTSKVAAALVGKNSDGRDFCTAHTNYWPEPIRSKLGANVRIGNGSGTIHAETACLLHAPRANNSSLFVTDLPCPNCVKNMAEAGVRHLYIDHKGYDKDYALRHGTDFDEMSLKICARAGISVSKVFRKEKRTEIILEIPPGYVPVNERPPKVNVLESAAAPDIFRVHIEKENGTYKDRPFALAFAQSLLGQVSAISAEVHPVIGYTSQTIEKPEGKYTYLLQPVNRVIMTASRYGLKIMDGYLYSSRVPTARELVNVIGAGLGTIAIGNIEDSRDKNGLDALHLLQNNDILKISA